MNRAFVSFIFRYMTFIKRNFWGSRRWTPLRMVRYFPIPAIVFLVLSCISIYSRGRPKQAIYAFPPQRQILRPYQQPNIVDYHFTPTRQLGDGEPEQDDKGFEHDQRDERFYLGGTLTLTERSLSHPDPFIYDPYPQYNSGEWEQLYRGRFRPCLGPRGRDLDRTSPEDMVLVYKGKQGGFPAPQFGSYQAMNLDGGVCTDRYSRYGAYGYGDDGGDDIPGFNRALQVAWDEVDWNKLQESCFERNSNRYEPNSRFHFPGQSPLSFEYESTSKEAEESNPDLSAGLKRYHPRSAVLIRAWHDMVWTTNLRQHLRSLIMELALHSGAEYRVFLLVHVKDDELPIFSDMQTIEQVKQSIPPEFRNISFFFNTKLLEAWYPRINEHRPKFQHHQAVQIFSQLYPRFDYYWQFELDARHTGHSYHFLDCAISFAKAQPRKYLWERNAYYYTPGAHGSWENFTQMVHDSLANKSSDTIWGPVPVTGVQPIGPQPPVPHPDNDPYDWGVGEEADHITFLPIFNPENTGWTFPNGIWNFEDGTRTPRRSAVVTMGRYSKRLLDLIHHAQATKGLGLVSEMTGASWSLHHGLKAVYVPHPIYADGRWTPAELARIYNPGPPENINGEPDSIWNFDHQFDHIMYRLSYMFTSNTAEDLYRRWLGYQGVEETVEDRPSETDYGRHCFPAMFLHPVKYTEEILEPERPA